MNPRASILSLCLAAAVVLSGCNALQLGRDGHADGGSRGHNRLDRYPGCRRDSGAHSDRRGSTHAHPAGCAHPAGGCQHDPG